MKLKDARPGESTYTQLARTALAVLVRREDGWCMYVGGVPGIRHAEEWQDVKDHGDKLDEATAKAICENRFHPPIDTEGLLYVD